MESLYDTIGRKQVELDNLRAEYARLLSVLAELKAGTLTPSELAVVDCESQSWRIERTPVDPALNGCTGRIAPEAAPAD